MAVGNAVDGGGLNAKLGDAAVTVKVSAHASQELSEWLNTLGANQTAIEQALTLAPFNFSAADAHNIYTYISYLNTLSGVYFGTATQAALFNFDTALAGPRGINP